MIRFELECTGTHKHPRPPAARASPAAKAELKSIVFAAPSTLPKSLQVGSSTLASVSNVSETFNNLDYVAYLRREFLREASFPDSISGLQQWQQQSAEHASFVRSSSLQSDDGFICVALDWMQSELGGWVAPLSTDALEGFLKTPNNACLLITVGWSFKTNRVAPLAMTVLMGKTAAHYEHHFDHLFNAMLLEVSAEGRPNWQGMTADFSSAQSKAFTTSLARYICAQRPLIDPHAAEKTAAEYLVVR